MIQTSTCITSVNSTTNNNEKLLPEINTIKYSYDMISNKRKEPVGYKKISFFFNNNFLFDRKLRLMFKMLNYYFQLLQQLQNHGNYIQNFDRYI